MPRGKYGDWQQMYRWLHNLSTKSYQPKFERELRQLGEAIAEKVKAHIEAQDLNWPALSEVTIANKEGDSKVYVDSGEYLRKIRAKVQPTDADGLLLTVAVEGSHHSGLSMQELAVILEYGTSKIPARPLWRPSFLEVESLSPMGALTDLHDKFGF